MKSLSKAWKLLAYICVPVIFSIIGYCFLYIALKPVWEIGRTAIQFIVSDDTPVFNANLGVIYDPDASTSNPVPIYLGSDLYTQNGITDDTEPETALSDQSSREGTKAADNTVSTVTEDQAAEDATEAVQAEESPAVPAHGTDTGTGDSAAKQTQTPVKEEPYIRIADIDFPVTGTQYAKIDCARIGLDAPVYWYDTDDILAYGVGQSIASFLPGFGRAIILSGHNTTYFRCLENITVGDIIRFDTNYYPYEYTVTDVEVLDEKAFSDVLVEKIGKEKEELVMYTCYPFYAITGRKTQRLVVTAERTKGVNVKWRNLNE